MIDEKHVEFEKEVRIVAAKEDCTHENMCLIIFIKDEHKSVFINLLKLGLGIQKAHYYVNKLSDISKKYNISIEAVFDIIKTKWPKR